METQITSSEIIDVLRKQIANDNVLAVALKESLVLANTGAKNGQLNSDLYQALNELYDGNGWPTNADDYYSYLTSFAEVIPSENQVPTYTAWNNNDQQNGYSQEIYDRLCHFYWLIDQNIEVNGQEIVLQNYVSEANGFKFEVWLDDYAKAWGDFLNTPASLTPETLQSFEDDPMYNLQDSSDYIDGWTTFNDFFYRQLNASNTDLTPMRPIASPNDNKVVSAPADCTFKAIYNIDASGNVIEQGQQTEGVTLKHTHTIGQISDLLNGSEYASAFNGGTFVHYFLSPFDYHRFHVPVAGMVIDSQAVAGNVFLDVVLDNGQFDAPDGSEDGYEFTQARGVIIVDTKDSPAGDIGKVAIVPVGMAQVSSVHMELNEGQNVAKGDEFGYFAFGGSDIILVFEKPQNQLLFIKEWANAQGIAAPFHFKYGEAAVIVG
ncbi:phosphatidylserine decarboxylase [Roseivirga sp. E12]|uniref:phosphatidylserine decarboxylase n=1 Tax=Roseivirga sp. E12 TaxID=2819237 RepID=UPI001ABC8710|nr:phosphatidylserine decarboxylase [Roseivirga sp. E12]MBO3698097.1 phosphatidylserine decarboxylase [Roseivirga sp. E12]